MLLFCSVLSSFRGPKAALADEWNLLGRWLIRFIWIYWGQNSLWTRQELLMNVLFMCSRQCPAIAGHEKIHRKKRKRRKKWAFSVGKGQGK